MCSAVAPSMAQLTMPHDGQNKYDLVVILCCWKETRRPRQVQPIFEHSLSLLDQLSVMHQALLVTIQTLIRLKVWGNKPHLNNDIKIRIS
jgi:hypothetical protein